jgi:uncharacterized protein YndB with AHSA1/START domain
MRVTETFTIARPPSAVFDYLADPSKLADWQTSKTSVEKLTDGPPRLGTRVRERTKGPGGREFEQVVELAEFDPPRRLRVHVIEGPYPVDGSWSLEAADAGTRVSFTAEGELNGAMRLLGPVARRMIARQFAAHHERLRANLEAAG